jgi:hypothetical protein
MAIQFEEKKTERLLNLILAGRAALAEGLRTP